MLVAGCAGRACQRAMEVLQEHITRRWQRNLLRSRPALRCRRDKQNMCTMLQPSGDCSKGSALVLGSTIGLAGPWLVRLPISTRHLYRSGLVVVAATWLAHLAEMSTTVHGSGLGLSKLLHSALGMVFWLGHTLCFFSEYDLRGTSKNTQKSTRKTCCATISCISLQKCYLYRTLWRETAIGNAFHSC